MIDDQAIVSRTVIEQLTENKLLQNFALRNYNTEINGIATCINTVKLDHFIVSTWALFTYNISL